MRVRPLLVATMCLAAAPLAAAAGGLASTVEQFEHLSVGAESVAVANLRVKSDHLDCLLVSGRAAPVRAGEDVVGFFFEGTVNLEYISAEPIEAPVVTFVAKKGTSLTPEKTDKGVRLRDTGTRLLWVSSGLPLPDLKGAAGAPLTESFRLQREKFRRKAGRTLSQDFAFQRVGSPGSPLLWVEMDGGKEDLVYRRDGVDDPGEELAFVHPTESNDPELRKSLWPVVLSYQPIGRDPRDPAPPRYVLTDVDVELNASAGNDARLSVVETIVPQKESQSVLRFDLRHTVYTTSGSNLATRIERLQKVTDEAGRALAFDHRNQELLVQLAQPAAPDRPLKLRFEIDGDFLVRPSGDNYWELGVWPWFPQPGFGSQYYTFHSLIRVKKPFIPFAPGITIRRVAEGEDNVLETRVDKPIQWASILAGKYEMEEQTKNGITIKVATYALSNPRAVKQLAALADSVITFYTEFLGPFPFSEFNILEINSLGFGQAPPGMMFITKEAFNPLAEDNQYFSQGVNERFAHEIAHQYWGHVVKMPSAEEQWITESFAEYSAAIFIKASKGDATYDSIEKHWRRRALDATDAAPIPLANRVWLANDPRMRFLIRYGLLYNKGPILLAALHKQLGDEVFLTFLKSYQKSFRWKFGSTKSMAALLQYMTKRDFGPFFEANYWGTGMPKE